MEAELCQALTEALTEMSTHVAEGDPQRPRQAPVATRHFEKIYFTKVYIEI